MQLLILTYLFIVGAVFGSFVGAMAWRYRQAMPLATDRSECEHCHHKLAAKDLLPVISWVWLRGTCRYCAHPIGYGTIGLEIAVGGAFALSYLFWPMSQSYDLFWFHIGVWLLAVVALAFLFIYDARHFILPDVVIFPLMGLGALLWLFQALLAHWSVPQAMLEAALSLIPVAGVYLLLYKVSSGTWVGFGDVKLGVFIGLALGWQGAMLVLFLSNLLGTLYIVPGLLVGKLTRRDHVPFGPFLIVATFVVYLWGSQFVTWYVSRLV